MRKFIFSLLFFLFLVINSYSQDCTSQLQISVKPASSLIYINDELFGRGDVRIDLPKGGYSLLIKENKYQWGSDIIKDTVVITDCYSTINRNYELGGEKVFINTKPSNAKIFYRDSLIAYTPAFIFSNLSDLRLVKDKYTPVSINDLAAYKKNLSGQPIKLDFIGKVDNESFLEQNLFKILVGGIVVFGTVTAYYKLKADKNFDDYNRTGEKHFLDITKEYDLISGISFALVQVNFGVLIYHFLIE